LEINEETEIYATSNGAVSKREAKNDTAQPLKELFESDKGVLFGSATKSFCSPVGLELMDGNSGGGIEGTLLGAATKSICSPVGLELMDGNSGGGIEGTLLGAATKSFCFPVGL
jgi:hypothetical protein